MTEAGTGHTALNRVIRSRTKATNFIDEILLFRYIGAASSNFFYGQEALPMDGRTAAGTAESPLQCQHKRLLERFTDREGKKTEMMKCCECGALMPKPASSRMPLHQ
jgi:hypothetical protein